MLKSAYFISRIWAKNMIKINKMGWAIITLIAIVIASTPVPASAFFSFLGRSNPNVSLVATVSNDFTSFLKGESPLKEDLSFISDSFLVGINEPASRILQLQKPNKTIWVTATAYSSTPDQTWGNPFITASGTHVRDGVVAANFLPLGTLIKIPDIYGDKVFIVEDRMNKRYWERIDLWFPDRQSAKNFGIKQVRIEIIS